MLSMDLHFTFTFYRWMSMRENSFLVCSVCDEIVSSYAQCAIKSFPRMLSIRMLYFLKITQKYLIKMQILTINNRNFEKPSRSPSNGTKVKILEKNFFLIAHQKNLVPRMLSHRENVQHRNSGENRRKIIEIFFGN
jgi:hypothetical protein